MRPPDSAHGENGDAGSASPAAARAPFGLHTHWTSPDHARPTDGDPAARGARLAPRAPVAAALLLRRGWYTDDTVQRTVAEQGIVDCTATTFPPVRRRRACRRRAAAGPDPRHPLARDARALAQAAGFRPRLLPRHRPARPQARARLEVGLRCSRGADRSPTWSGQRGFRPLKTITFANKRALSRRNGRRRSAVHLLERTQKLAHVVGPEEVEVRRVLLGVGRQRSEAGS